VVAVEVVEQVVLPQMQVEQVALAAAVMEAMEQMLLILPEDWPVAVKVQ
jgi:hypothetical protein